MNELDMWDYWKGKYGEIDALKEYYPDLLKSDPMLTAAVAQAEIALLAINARMRMLAEQAERDQA